MIDIITSDCIKFIDKIENESLDLVFSDPPFNKKKDYGIYKDNLILSEYYYWCEEWIKKTYDKLKPTGSFYLYTNSQHLGKFQMIGQKYFLWKNTIIWHYTNPTPIRNHYPRTYSAFLFFTKSKKYTFNKDAIRVKTFQNNKNIKTKVEETRLYDCWSDIPKLTGGFLAQKEVILKPGTKQREFVYQLPIELLRRIVLTSSNEGDLVTDYFSHSGTTALVCKMHNRNFYGCDLNPEYVRISKKRINEILC